MKLKVYEHYYDGSHTKISSRITHVGPGLADGHARRPPGRHDARRVRRRRVRPVAGLLHAPRAVQERREQRADD